MASRLGRHDKKRKINKFYNIAITIVSLLIVIVAITIFTNNDVDPVSKEQEKTTPKEEVKEPTPESEPEDKGKDETEEAVTEEAEEESESESEEEQTDGVKLEQIEGSGDANVLNTYTSEDWQPIGTEQTGSHTTSFEKGSKDWNEMTKAIAYGAGLDEGSMRLWWLKNGGSPTTAIGTVSEGDNPQAYRVYIEWVDGAGWKPVKVEELKENDRGR
ncbi:YrrS family protein [Peribacillus asahii]|uniref:Uncharacterized protein n=1 Tax=Peribacillus asahii TaxID=228899 RepID=A0A3Q9RQF3_9BACI|nr:YrrS family protein [Peribacillus asahii]AZV44496.1 hypothetical protein BAOM_3887 [Peribacillus asahii]USK84177.1 YrrS family protein [Peribacillus asahii]